MMAVLVQEWKSLFLSRHAKRVSILSLIIPALLLVISWPGRDYQLYLSFNRSPNTFFIYSLTAFVLLAFLAAYLGTDAAGRETRWSIERLRSATDISLLAILSAKSLAAVFHMVLVSLFHIPLIIASAGISGIPSSIFISSYFIILVSTIVYRLIGLNLVGLFKRRKHLIYLFTWILIGFFVILTLKIFPFWNNGYLI